MRRLVAFILCATSPLAGGPKAADAEKQEQPTLTGPVDIRSERLLVEQDKSRAVFSGQVTVRQDRLQINCEQLVVEYDQPQEDHPAIQRMLFSGRVEINLDDKRGGCLQAEYRRAGKLVVCSGDAWLSQGQNRILGEQIEYHLESRQINVKKPRAVLQLEKKATVEGKKADGPNP